MQRTWIQLLAISTLLGCNAASVSDGGARRPLSDEFLRKQQDCENRAPSDRSKFEANLDYGPTFHDSSRAAVWKPQKVYLANTCFLANAGPYYYIGNGDKELASYAIDIEINASDATAPGRPIRLVLFSRSIKLDELPSDFKSIEIGDVVFFDEAQRIVRFKIGRHIYEYRLPAL
jgi:hypothetical protein